MQSRAQQLTSYCDRAGLIDLGHNFWISWVLLLDRSGPLDHLHSRSNALHWSKEWFDLISGAPDVVTQWVFLASEREAQMQICLELFIWKMCQILPDLFNQKCILTYEWALEIWFWALFVLIELLFDPIDDEILSWNKLPLWKALFNQEDLWKNIP